MENIVQVILNEENILTDITIHQSMDINIIKEKENPVVFLVRIVVKIKKMGIVDNDPFFYADFCI